MVLILLSRDLFGTFWCWHFVNIMGVNLYWEKKQKCKQTYKKCESDRSDFKFLGIYKNIIKFIRTYWKYQMKYYKSQIYSEAKYETQSVEEIKRALYGTHAY